jgi:predicted DNA-binding protein with PD1-like motif
VLLLNTMAAVELTPTHDLASRVGALLPGETLGTTATRHVHCISAVRPRSPVSGLLVGGEVTL